ncbi:MAG: protein kinase [Rhodobacteraceae bacterium]|nr:protein kinase [Paracoccaceae bacterium]
MSDDTPPTTSAGGPVPGPQKVSTTVTAGTLIMGTYEIEKIINSGGMGEVYRGRNIHNGEPVAIKIVLPSLAHDPKIVALFQKESTVLSRLSHEAIVRYHVFTNDPTIGRPCMVMEFVSGLPLADRVEQGPMPVDQVKVMLRRVASGLDKAHRAGVVHRDLSPDNVILEEDSVEHAKLIDFGIAKSSSFGSGTLLGGQFAGKFNWVSPEQLGAYGGVVDGRSDIYSLALITAAASRGKVLQMGASIVDAVGKRATVPALDGVDPELVPLLTWMLQPDPALRVESMAKVIAALENPALIPQAKAPEPPAPDPNRTVIEPLPVMTAAPVSQPSVPTAPPPQQTAAPVAQVTGWDRPAQATAPPDGATVIAPHPAVTAAPLYAPPEEPEDASPFGAPAAQAPRPPQADPAPVVPVKNGKGGLITVLVLLAVLGGAGGAWVAGVFDPKPPGPEVVVKTDPAPEAPKEPAVDPAAAEAEAKAAAEAQAAAEAKAAADAQAAADAKAAADAQAAADAKAKADAQAAADAEAKAKADAEAEAKAKAEAEALAAAAANAEAAAKAAVEGAKAKAEGADAARGIAENALAEAQNAADDIATAAEGAAALALTDTAVSAADRAEAAQAAATCAVRDIRALGETIKDQPEAEKALAEALAAAEADQAAADAAATQAAEAAALAGQAAKAVTEAEAARAAEEKAKADALAADPVARQQAFVDGYALPACVAVNVLEARAEGFRLQGFAADTAPLEKLSADWAAATGLTPDVTVALVNEEQCAALEFVVANKAMATVSVTLDAPSGVVKSGTSAEGTITGINGRPFTLFLVNGAGGATNVNKWVTPGEDGTMRFKFAPKLKEGAPPSPQLLLLVIGDEALAQALEGIKRNVIVKQLAEFVGERLKASETDPALGLGFFRLEN